MSIPRLITSEEADELMSRFSQAFVTADAEALTQCLAKDFVWHLHEGPDSPHARTAYGVEGMLQILRDRKKNWKDVRYTDVSVSTDGSLIIQTFRVSGRDSQGRHFDVRAVDLYPVEGGKIKAKDSYWKNVDRT
jgi:ketosteroid isomerase-like protein